MPVYETIYPIIAPTPTLPNPVQFRGAVMLRCGPKGGPYNNLQLPANPDQAIVTDFRVTMIQTLSGIYFDDYGKGISDFTLNGNTAWSSPQGLYNGNPINGYQAGYHLQWDIIDHYFSGEHDKSNPQNMELLIFDYTKNASWSVKPVGKMQTSQTKDSPMTINYSISFKIIEDKIHDQASPDMKPNDPVQALIVGTTNAPQTMASVWGSSTTQSTAPATVDSIVKASQVASQTQKQTYVVVNGDSLWAIAVKFYGQGMGYLYPRIWDANKAHIANPNLIFPGQTITIPPAPNSNAA